MEARKATEAEGWSPNSAALPSLLAAYPAVWDRVGGIVGLLWRAKGRQARSAVGLPMGSLGDANAIVSVR
jgi:hypothetical protein